MQTWSTIKRLISILSVQVLLTFSYATNNIIHFIQINSGLTSSPMLDELDTAAVTLHGVGHVPPVRREVEGVETPNKWK